MSATIAIPKSTSTRKLGDDSDDLSSALKEIRDGFMGSQGIAGGWDEIAREVDETLTGSFVLAEKVAVESQYFEDVMLIFSQNPTSLTMDVVNSTIQIYATSLVRDQPNASMLCDAFKDFVTSIEGYSSVIKTAVIEKIADGLMTFSDSWNNTADTISVIQAYIGGAPESLDVSNLLYYIQAEASTYSSLSNAMFNYAQLGGGTMAM